MGWFEGSLGRTQGRSALGEARLTGNSPGREGRGLKPPMFLQGLSLRSRETVVSDLSMNVRNAEWHRARGTLP